AIRSQRDALDELDREWESRAAVARVLNQERHGEEEDLRWRSHGRLYRAFGPSSPLAIPILGPGLDGGQEPVDQSQMDALLGPALGAVGSIPEVGIPGLATRDLVPEGL